MHTPSLKGLAGYQQPPSLGGQGVAIPPREDTGAWALPVCAWTVPYNLQVHALGSRCPVQENPQRGVGPRVLCRTPQCPSACWRAVAHGNFLGGCCAQPEQQLWCYGAVSCSIKLGLTTAAASTARFLPCPVLSIFMFSSDFSSSCILLCFKSLFVSLIGYCLVPLRAGFLFNMTNLLQTFFQTVSYIQFAYTEFTLA